jgi:hypothetical protein
MVQVVPPIASGNRLRSYHKGGFASCAEKGLSISAESFLPKVILECSGILKTGRHSIDPLFSPAFYRGAAGGHVYGVASVGLLDVLSSAPADPSVARLVSKPVSAASLLNPVRKAG